MSVERVTDSVMNMFVFYVVELDNYNLVSFLLSYGWINSIR